MKRLYLLNFLPFIAVSASMIFIPVIAMQLGLSLVELGVVSALYSVGALTSYYLFARWSDVTGKRAVFIKTGLFLFALTVFMQVLMHDFVSMLLIRFAVGFALGVFSFPLVAAAAGLEGMKTRIANISAFGSLGWFFGQLIAGAIADFSLIFSTAALASTIAAFASLKLPELRAERVKVSLFPVQIIKRNARLYFAVFLRSVGAWSVWTVFPLYLLEMKASLLWIGLILSINPLTQFFASHYVGAMVRGASEGLIVKAGLALAALTFLGYAFSTHYLQLVPIQITLGVSWAFMYTGALIHLASNNIERATATSLLGNAIRIGMIVGPVLGGAIAFLFGFRATMYFAFAAALLALLVVGKL